MKKIAVVGAGFSGAVIARELASKGYAIDVFDQRKHVAGNCHTKRDGDTGIMLHEYGPHIFHTSNRKVWDYVQQFDTFMPFVNRVKALTGGRMFSLPINLLTINQFFGKSLDPRGAQAFLQTLGDRSVESPATFEEQALRFVGKDLYEAFFKAYTIKQWGLPPSALPASILKRLPLRFNYDDNYYASDFQGLPMNGYTHIVEKILDMDPITLHLGSRFEPSRASEYDHVFYSGPINEWFDNCHGRLAYRTLDFEREFHRGDYQGNAVINYCDDTVPWTRISEHKHFSPWEKHEDTIIFKEYSRECTAQDTPYYPVRLANDKSQLAQYVALAQGQEQVTFVGRLGTYRYLDMHVTIAEAMDVAEEFLRSRANRVAMKAFVVDPLA
jgi:UDP-galactopyranose mutase